LSLLGISIERRHLAGRSVGIQTVRLAMLLGCMTASLPAYAQNTATPSANQDSTPQVATPEDSEPIISDEEFERSVPKIDDPAGDAAPVTPEEPLAALPPNDAEIDQPLTPLAGFDVEPFDDSRYTEAAETKATQVRYRYRIEGLDQLRDDNPVAPVTAADIRSQFDGLSALDDGDGKAANGAMINARLEEDQKLLADILSGQGFFDATVNGSLELPAQNTQDPITVILTAAPGPRYALGAIQFDAPPVTPADLITGAFLPKAGEPIVADRILAAEANIAVVLPENGYPFVKIGDRDILLDAPTRIGDYTLPLTPGPRSSFGDILSTGAKPVFEPDHIAKIARFKKGDLYDSRKVDDLRQALVATGLFSVVAVDPKPSGEPAGDGTDYATLSVSQQAGPARSLAGQLGYQTGQGIKLDGSWTHRNMFPPEGALIGTATLGTQEQGIGGTFRRSNAGKRDRSVEMSLTANHSNFDAYEAYTGRLAGRVSYDSTPIWQKRLTYSYGFELIGTNEQDYDFEAAELRRRTFYLLALPVQVLFDTSNSLLDPTRGFRIAAKLSPETSLGSGAQVYSRSALEGTGYYPVSDGFVLAGRARVSMINGVSREQIAPSRRIYGGGGGSVRGFGFQELGPKDPEDRPIGGRSSVEAAAEVRYRFGNYGVVAFLDAGQVYTSSIPKFDDWRFGVGIGGRFYTNFGPMRLDVATPLNRKPGESRISVYVSIGQAF
jgi:translocation and assembly module TamA